MRKLALYSVAILFTGCTTGVPLKTVDYNNLLNDHNSKVWIVNKQVVNGVNIAPGLDSDKDLIIFHNSGVINVFPMKGLGSKSGRKGVYYLNSEKKTLEFVFSESENWIMDLEYITEDSVYMKQAKGSTVDFDIQIKPIPEFDLE